MWSDTEELSGVRKATIVLAAILAIIAVLTVADLIEDSVHGVGWGHIVSEGIIVLAAVIGLLLSWWVASSSWQQSHSRLKSDLLSAREDSQKWKSKAKELLSGLGVEIEKQFDQWGLSHAEKEVGILLLKGLSLRDIAEIRQTSEKTVRQQAAALYKKGQLEGRAQLSAFFLEDLLIPQRED